MQEQIIVQNIIDFAKQQVETGSVEAADFTTDRILWDYICSLDESLGDDEIKEICKTYYKHEDDVHRVMSMHDSV
jgi:hypothetical protein